MNRFSDNAFAKRLRKSHRVRYSSPAGNINEQFFLRLKAGKSTTRTIQNYCKKHLNYFYSEASGNLEYKDLLREIALVELNNCFKSKKFIFSKTLVELNSILLQSVKVRCAEIEIFLTTPSHWKTYLSIKERKTRVIINIPKDHISFYNDGIEVIQQIGRCSHLL